MLIPLLLLTFSIAIIFFGARWLVEGASELAAYFGVPPLVIGLTIVAFGTSLPELMLGIVSGLEGVNSLSVGNVVGSNISNATYIIGSCALLAPIIIRFSEIRRDALFMLTALVVLTIFSADGRIDSIEGAVMIILFTTFLVLLIRSLYFCAPKQAVVDEFEAARPEKKPPVKSLLFLAIGASILIVGTDIAVSSASSLASLLGMSEYLIGMTIVTLGTTTPEFATSLIAAYKKRPDIAVGNTIGTLVFNATMVLGSGALIAPLIIPQSQWLLGILPMLLFGTLLAGIVYRRGKIGRVWGAGLIILYLVYIGSILSFT